jgi:CelD/BcsL family acetyltransferase involved in cellulose biosynthesis
MATLAFPGLALSSVAESPSPNRAPRGERSLLLVPQAHAAWTELLARSADATPFHHPAWSSLLDECYGYRSFAAVLVERSRAVAGLPLIELRSLTGRRRWISLPFTDECSPLAVSPAAGVELVTRLADIRRESGLSSIEIRADVDAPGAWCHAVGYNHVLDLGPDPQAVRSRFKRSRVQRSLTSGERGPLRIAWATTEADLVDRFYRLHIATRRRQGVPVQPRRFFRLLWSRVMEPGLGFVLLAYAGGTPVAGAVFLTFGRTVVYKFGASEPEHWKLHPNHLLLWEAIRWGCGNDFERFDFGRTEFGNEGLRSFKAGWATREKLLRYSVVADEAPSWSPSRLQKAAGAAIKHSPPLVCRALGEALYRYAA